MYLFKKQKRKKKNTPAANSKKCDVIFNITETAFKFKAICFCINLTISISSGKVTELLHVMKIILSVLTFNLYLFQQAFWM